MKRHPSSAFTLIELILVMAIIATVMALAAPQLARWKKGGKLRNSADAFIAATRWARSKAAADGSIFAITVDGQSNSYHVQVQAGQQYADVDGQFHNAVTLTDGQKIESNVDSILFYPTGRLDPATIKITGEDGDTITVQCTTPAGDFAVLLTQTS